MRKTPIRSGVILGALLATAFWIACSSDENAAPNRSPIAGGEGGEASSGNLPSGCPSTAPSNGDSCGNEGVSCGYACASCTCTMGKFVCTGSGGTCGAHTACPPTEPANGSSCAPSACCPMSPQQTPCNYQNSTASCAGNVWTLTAKPPQDSGNDVNMGMDSGDSGDSG